MGSAQVDPFGDPEAPGSRCRPGSLLVDRRDEISACPELVSGEVLRLSLDIQRDPNRAFALNKADHFCNRVFRWNRDQHVDMIGHQTALLDPTFPVGLCKT